jgi:hypothetical protein
MIVTKSGRKVNERGWAMSLRKICPPIKWLVTICPHCGGFGCKPVGPTCDRTLIYKCHRCENAPLRKDV